MGKHIWQFEKEYDDAFWMLSQEHENLEVLERELAYRREVEVRFKDKWFHYDFRKPYGHMPSREANDERISRLVTLIEHCNTLCRKLVKKKRNLWKEIEWHPDSKIHRKKRGRFIN